VLGLINKLGAERLEKGDVPAGSDVEPDAEEPGLDPDADPDAARGAAARGPAPAGPLEGDDD
jgi:hypothetical protein